MRWLNPRPSARLGDRSIFPPLAREAAALGLCVLSACSDHSVLSPTADPGAAPRQATVASVPMARQARAAHAPGRVLVRFRPGVDRTAVAAQHGASPQREIIPGIWLASVPEGAELSVATALSRNPNVVFAEPDFVRVFEDPVCPGCVPGDDLFEWQWNMHNDGLIDLGATLQIPTGAVDADIDWLEAFGHLGPTPSGTVRIGVLDTGIRASHEDFCGKDVIWKDFYDPASPAPFDDHGHGTHVSGIAGACADNGKGVVGVAYGPNMEFLVGKVCAQDGSCLASAIAESIQWATDNGANVLNMSFGDTQPSQTEAQALAYAAGHNVLSVCAAGNDAVESVLYPAADPNCVAVSATGWGDGLASYSSFGPQVELSAPGGDFLDLFGTSMIASAWAGFDDDYVLTMGTSMAAPHVTGLAALLYALGVQNATDLRTCLRNTADDLGTPGWDKLFGWGRINMYQAVLNAGSCAGSGGGGDNLPPSALFVFDCSDLTCSFDGSGSWDPDGQITSQSWDFGDGATGSGATVTHTFAAPGTYTTTLTVLDDRGGSDTSAQDVSVGVIHVGDLEAWSAKAKGNRWGAYLEVTVVGLDGDPVPGATVSVVWTGATGGSASEATGSDGTVTFETGSIRESGTVTFTVTGVTHPSLSYGAGMNTDADGDSDGTTVAVGPPNAAPQAAFTDECGDVSCSFSDQSTDPDGTIVAWWWDFGDTGTSTEQNPQHEFSGSSPFYTVSLTVTDDMGATDTVSRDVFVPPLDLGLTLEAQGSKAKGSKEVNLIWSGGSGIFPVDIYRNGSPLASAVEGSTYLDLIGRGGESSYSYQVCETTTNVCSNVATVTF